MPVSVVWTRTVGPKRPQVCVNVWRGEVSGRGEVPGVGANLDGEGGAVTKVENHSLRSVHPPARLDLSVLYGRYCFSYGLENRLQFVLGGGWADYLGVFSATRLLAVHPCSFGSCERPLPSDTAHILPLLGPAPPALEAVKRVTSWRGFIPLCVMPYETGVNVLGCNSKRQHFVTGRVSPRPPISARAVVKPTGNGRFPPTI